MTISISTELNAEKRSSSMLFYEDGVEFCKISAESSTIIFFQRKEFFLKKDNFITYCNYIIGYCNQLISNFKYMSQYANSLLPECTCNLQIDKSGIWYSQRTYDSLSVYDFYFDLENKFCLFKPRDEDVKITIREFLQLAYYLSLINQQIKEI